MIKRYVHKAQGYRYEIEVKMDGRGNVTILRPDNSGYGFMFLFPKQARRVAAALQKEFGRRDKRDARAK